MITRELLDYVAKQKGAKISNNDIKKELETTGWKTKDIDFALEYKGKSNIPLPPYEQELKNIEKGYRNIWDAFLHIIMFISMYISTISVWIILYKYIDLFFPKHNLGYGYYRNPLDDLEVPIAALVVTFPFFVGLFLKLTKDTKAHPQIKNLLTRKVLIYATLIASFITTVVSLITVVASFISGELGTNFVLKIVVAIVLSGIIFVHYLGQVKSDREENV